MLRTSVVPTDPEGGRRRERDPSEAERRSTSARCPDENIEAFYKELAKVIDDPAGAGRTAPADAAGVARLEARH
jgi:hypothetical protein